MNEPRLHYGLKTFVVARDPENNQILIGGLGCLGVGQMWFNEEPRHKNEPGYSEAEIVSKKM